MSIGPAAGLEAAAAAISSLIEPEPEGAHDASSRSAQAADAVRDLTAPSSAAAPEVSVKRVAARDADHLDLKA